MRAQQHETPTLSLSKGEPVDPPPGEGRGVRGSLVYKPRRESSVTCKQRCMLRLIPDELRRAHEDEEVVFFCGAGVSMPAKLPSFKGLVEAILAELLPPSDMCKPGSTEALAWRAFEDHRYDEALNILESSRLRGYEPRVVREKVSNHLSKDPKTLNPHVILVRLADLDTDRGRLVTTNFDDFFEKADEKLRRRERSAQKMRVHIAPALPPAKRATWRGLVHLHGLLGVSENDRDLVLTTADFGTAYMLEGWARRFVVDLFRHYHVVFVGYRVEDPTMRYLVSALAAAREESGQLKEAYTFAPYGAGECNPKSKEEVEQDWKLKGLRPLLYDNNTNDHHGLWQELKEWADDHRQGILGRRQVAARLGQFPPVEKESAVAELAWALKDPNVSKYFAGLRGAERPHVGWIEPLQKQSLLSLPVGQTKQGEDIAAPLVSHRVGDQVSLHEVTFQLSGWIADSIDTQEALDWALSNGGVLHAALRWQIQQRLHQHGDRVRPALLKIWRVLADDEYAYALAAKSQHPYPAFPRLGSNTPFASRSFLNRLRPIPMFKVKRRFLAHEGDPHPERPSDWCEITIELVGIEADHAIRRFQERAEDWEGFLASTADDLTTRLKEAMDWFSEFGLASSEHDITYVQYRSISPHSQNRYAPVWTHLIALTRDSYGALISSGKEDEAARLARRWRALPYPVFRRLALYAATGGRNA